jgi:mannose-6-phosphate isomerase-like protein (cupin superfamily)
VSTTLNEPYRPTALGRVEDYELLLVTAQGDGPAEVAPAYGALWLVVRGRLEVRFGDVTHPVEAGHLAKVEPGTPYALKAEAGTLAVTVGNVVSAGD